MNTISSDIQKKSYLLEFRVWSPDRKGYVKNNVQDFSLKDKLKEAKMQQCKIIMYGQNTFAYDDEKRKMLIASIKLPSIILLDYGDLVSYKLMKDGVVLTGMPLGGSDESSGYDAVPDENGVLCTDLVLTIAAKNPSYPEAVMPFIYFPQKSGNFYRQALDAALETVKVLESIYYSRSL